MAPVARLAAPALNSEPLAKMSARLSAAMLAIGVLGATLDAIAQTPHKQLAWSTKENAQLRDEIARMTDLSAKEIQDDSKTL